MSSKQQFNLVILVLFIITCCACIREIKATENDDSGQLRNKQKVQKTSESESVKKQQQKEAKAVTKSQLALPASDLLNADNAVLPNDAFKLRLLSNPLNYAYKYPYQNYPTQLFSPNIFQGYLYENPALALNSFEPVNNNLAAPPFFNKPAHLIEYGIKLPHQLQLKQLVNQPILPPAPENTLLNYGLPQAQMNWPHKLGLYGEQFAKPLMPFNYPGLQGNKFMGAGGVPEGTSVGHLFQPYAQVPAQPTVMQHLPGVPHSGSPTDPNVFIPDILRNQRMLKENFEDFKS